jgi:hypothetical protein
VRFPWRAASSIAAARGCAGRRWATPWARARHSTQRARRRSRSASQTATYKRGSPGGSSDKGPACQRARSGARIAAAGFPRRRRTRRSAASRRCASVSSARARSSTMRAVGRRLARAALQPRPALRAGACLRAPRATRRRQLPRHSARVDKRTARRGADAPLRRRRAAGARAALQRQLWLRPRRRKGALQRRRPSNRTRGR